MSVFSKLFSGSPKGETEAAPTPAAEEGPSMQRPPNDGRGAGAAQQPSAQPQKGTPSSAKPTQRGMPAANAPQSKSGTANVQPSSGSTKAAPAAAPPASGPRVAAGASAQAKGATAPAVVVTRPIDVGATAPGATAPGASARADAGARAGSTTGASRPAMPAISIGPPTAPAAAASPPAAKAVAATPGEPARNSVRPTAPEMMMAPPSNGQASIADTFERLLSTEDLDAGFASIERTSVTPGAYSVVMSDLAEVRVLFAQLAANHVRQVRDFMIDLRWSDATIDWLPICEPALRSLRRAADKLELTDLCESLDRFSTSLGEATASGAKAIAGTAREALLARYDELSRLMPQAFALDLDRTQREAAILQSLLLQVPEVKKVTLDRMYSAGLTTLEAMFLATPGDIAATTGIPEALATQIVDRFQAYREQVKATVPDATRAHDREHIAELTAKLRREHDQYERASGSWSPGAADQKKEMRKAREQTLLDIQVALARLGEVDRLAQLERLPFEKKLAHLESFLEEARDKYVAQP
jgi:hypothetical protein